MILRTKLILYITYTCLLFGSVSSFRIIGGRPALEGEFPHQVSIRLAYNDEHICGGSILTARHILTAAHCMYYTFGGVRPPIIISVIAGQLDLSVTEASFYSNASAIIIHEEYVYGEWHEDIAIIELETELPLNSNSISAIALREIGLDAGRCIVSGWGVEEFEAPEISEILLAAEVNIVEFSVCQEMYALAEIELYDSMMCAGHQNGETDACEGDSGGPLICNGLLSGVVSTGVECGLAEYPGIYTDVSKFVAWIEEHVDLPLASTPGPSSEAPDPSSENPNPSSEAPDPSSENPNPSSEGPDPSSENPNPSSEGPDPSSENPNPSSEAPDPSSENPNPSSEGPNTSSEGPDSSISPPIQTTTPSTANLNLQTNVVMLVLVTIFVILHSNILN